MIEFAKKCEKRIKLFLVYFMRIVFVRSHFKCSLFKKIAANVRGYLADQWMLYDFDHNDRNEYLSEFDWYRSRYINEPFDFVLNNKIVSTQVLGDKVRMSEIYAFKNGGRIIDFENGVKTDAKALCAVVKKEGKAFIKPFNAGQGTDAHRLSFSEGIFCIDGKPVSEEEMSELFAKKKSFMLCECMEQHDYANALFPDAVHTMRIITLREPATHEWKIFFAVQRMGTSKTVPVDNGSRGGLVSKIDLETGALTEARCLHNRNVYHTHPDTGVVIEGTVIPQWKEIKEKVMSLAANLPYMNFIAWDLLLTQDGDICVIEANTSSGVNIIQLWGGQRKGELGDFYRHHGVIK